MVSLSEKYIAAVQQRLPRALRSEAGAELRATILDMTRSRSGRDAEREVLSELGDPAEVAAEYTGAARYVVGPEMYPDYVRLLKVIVPVVLPLIAVIVALPRVVLSDDHPAQVIAFAAFWTFMVGVQLIFWVTIVFVVAERAGGRHRKAPRSWTPDELTAPQGASSRADAAFSIVAVLLLLMFLPWQHFTPAVPIVDPYLWRGWLPALCVLLAGLLLVDMHRVRSGAWTRATAALTIVLDLVILGVLIWAAIESPLINPEFLETLTRADASFNPWIVVAVIGVFLFGDIVSCLVGARTRRRTAVTKRMKQREEGTRWGRTANR